MIHASVQTRAGLASLTDITPDDIEAIVRFWHEGSDALLDYIGIDRAKLGPADNTRKRYERAVRSGDPAQMNIAFAIRLDDRIIGYTLLNRYTTDINYSHWHIIDADLRGLRISSVLYPHRLKMYFDLTPMQRLIHQTRTHNTAVNRMLDKWVPVAETQYVEKPDGVALPGEFHLRYVQREDVPRFFARAS
jgi:hypothetical protein